MPTHSIPYAGFGVFSLRAVAFALAPLAFNQAKIATGKLTKESSAHFYSWFLSVTLQIFVFVLSYMRYIEPRPYNARLSFSGSFGWGGLLVIAGGLATSGIWCLLFTDEGHGGPNERSRSSSWLFPTQEKRREKAERREKRSGYLVGK